MFAFKYVIQLGMKGPQTINNAAWSKKILNAFYDLCIKAIDMRMR